MMACSTYNTVEQCRMYAYLDHVIALALEPLAATAIAFKLVTLVTD